MRGKMREKNEKSFILLSDAFILLSHVFKMRENNEKSFILLSDAFILLSHVFILIYLQPSLSSFFPLIFLSHLRKDERQDEREDERERLTHILWRWPIFLLSVSPFLFRSLLLSFQDAGAQIITVHGRTRENKGATATPANWEIIKKIKEHVSVPVISNGNIVTYQDVVNCLEATTADGVMCVCVCLCVCVCMCMCVRVNVCACVCLCA